MSSISALLSMTSRPGEQYSESGFKKVERWMLPRKVFHHGGK